MISWKREGEGGNSRGTRVNADYLVEKLYFVFGEGKERSTRNRNLEAISRIEDGKGRWRKEEGEAFSFARVFFRVYLYARANFIYTGPSKVNADVARGMSEGERRVERKRTKESSVDEEEVVERARIPGKHGKVGN